MPCEAVGNRNTIAALYERLIEEIMDSLPEDQRAGISMYYYQKDITEALDVLESAFQTICRMTS